MKLLPVILLTGCAATLSVQSNAPNTTVYVTKTMTSPDAPPAIYEASGTAPMVCSLDYFAWDNYYIWASAPGYQTQVIPLPNEVKVPQAIGAVCCFLPLAIWAYGPTEGPIQVTMVPYSAALPEGPLPVYAEDGTLAGHCEVVPADGEL